MIRYESKWLLYVSMTKTAHALGIVQHVSDGCCDTQICYRISWSRKFSEIFINKLIKLDVWVKEMNEDADFSEPGKIDTVVHDSCEQRIKMKFTKIQLSGVRDSLLSAGSVFNGPCLRQKF